MKINKAFIAERKKKFEELETKKRKTEEEKNKVEIRLEDIKVLLELNNEQIDSLLEENEIAKQSKKKMIRLFYQTILIIIILIALGLTINLTILILLIGYSIFCIPKYINLYTDIKKYDPLRIKNDIKKLKKSTRDLENKKELLLNIIKKLNYSIDNIDNEQKVIQDTLTFILNQEKDIINTELQEKKEINFSRIKPYM